MQKIDFTDEELRVAGKAAKFIVDRGFATPALLFIELNRPLNYVGSQVLALFEPFIQAFVMTNDYPAFVNFLEKRESVDKMLELIEALDEEQRKKMKEIKKERKNRKKRIKRR
ncbi:hypothetical protein KAR04_00335 [Candidatus Calescamantes bacterium]|nr:hypothetical protein [Candidatus Calescamantes bacterium]MCK5598120.1 hypothetical protein [bacterium]